MNNWISTANCSGIIHHSILNAPGFDSKSLLSPWTREISDKFSRKFINLVCTFQHVSTVRSKLPSVSHLRKIPQGDSRCKSWKAEYRLSLEEGEVLEDAVRIGVLDDAICCHIVFVLKLQMWGASYMFGFWAYFAMSSRSGDIL